MKNPYELDKPKLIKYFQEIINKEKMRIGIRLFQEYQENEKKDSQVSRASSSQSSKDNDDDESSSVDSAEHLDKAGVRNKDDKTPESMAERDPEFSQFRDACK